MAMSRNIFRSGILLWTSFHYALHTILMRYSRSRRVTQMYLPSVAVFWMEAIKLTICLTLVTWEHRGFYRAIISIRKSITGHPMDAIKFCILSFVYTISNNLFYIAATHLDAVTFAISSQMKLLTTAVFSVIILRKPVCRLQWLALFILFGGVSVVQWSNLSSPVVSRPSRNISRERSNSHLWFAANSSSFLGVIAAFMASLLAGFAGVYFEKVLKAHGPGSNISEVSVWMRNVQLATSAIPIALITTFVEGADIVREHGFLYGFDWIVWLTIFWSSIGGLSFAVCVKYTDTIRKNLATSVAILLSTLMSICFFCFRPNISFLMGSCMVVGAVFMYTKYAVFGCADPDNSSVLNKKGIP